MVNEWILNIDKPSDEEGITKVKNTYDIILFNGLLKKNQTTLQSWGCHPTMNWFQEDYPGEDVYLVDWEHELLSRIDTMFYDTMVNDGSEGDD